MKITSDLLGKKVIYGCIFHSLWLKPRSSLREGKVEAVSEKGLFKIDGKWHHPDRTEIVEVLE
mgnify:CR=1 FL=1